MAPKLILGDNTQINNNCKLFSRVYLFYIDNSIWRKYFFSFLFSQDYVASGAPVNVGWIPLSAHYVQTARPASENVE
jgi:hypothetical protein